MAEIEIAEKSIKGSLILSAGNLVFTATSAASLVLIQRLLGPAQYGLYALALVIPGLLQNFLDFGVSTAGVKYSAYYVSIGRLEEARRFTLNAIRFVWLTGVAFMVLNFTLAGTLSALLLHRPELTPYVQLMSLSILGNAILLTASSAALGWTWMSLSSISQIIQSTLRLVLSPFLIFTGLGVFGALTGHVASFFAAGLVGTIILYAVKLRGPTGAASGFITDVKEMLRFGLPLYAGSLIYGLAVYYVTIILAVIANNIVFGLFQTAMNFLYPVNLASTSLVNALLPAFASVDGIGGNVQAAFRHAYKFVAFLLTPVIFFLISASSSLIVVLPGVSFMGSVPYLQLLALAYLPVAFGYTVHSAFFNGFGRTKLTMLMNLSGAVTLVVCASLFSFLFNLGVNGLIYATFLSYFVGWIVGTVFAHKYLGATMDFRANAAILLISAVSYVGTLVVPKVSDVLAVLLYLLVFFGIYITLAPLTRAVNNQDIDIVGGAFGKSRLVGRLVAPILRYERLIIALTSRKRAV